MIQKNLQNTNRFTDLENKHDCQQGRIGGRIIREFGIDMYTSLYLKLITNKDLKYGTGNSAQCYVVAWMGGKFGGEWIYVHVWLSCFAVYLELSQCC